jgi:hypothetical protein
MGSEPDVEGLRQWLYSDVGLPDEIVRGITERFNTAATCAKLGLCQVAPVSFLDHAWGQVSPQVTTLLVHTHHTTSSCCAVYAAVKHVFAPSTADSEGTAHHSVQSPPQHACVRRSARRSREAGMRGPNTGT